MPAPFREFSYTYCITIEQIAQPSRSPARHLTRAVRAVGRCWIAAIILFGVVKEI
jgi:hypothetical protein